MKNLRFIVVQRSIVFGMVALHALSSSAEKPIRWKYEKGRIRSVQTVQETIQTIGETELKTVFRTFHTIEVEDVHSDGSATVLATLSRVSATIHLPSATAPIAYDSASDEATTGTVGMIAKALRPLKGRRHRLKVDQLGKVISSELIAGGSSLSANPKPLFDPMIDKKIGVASWTGCFFKLPDSLLSEGESEAFAATDLLPHGIPLSSETTLTYIGERQADDRTVDRFGLNTTFAVKKPELNTDSTSDPNSWRLFEIKDQQSSGSIDFDNSIGVIEKMDTVSHVTVRYEVGGEPIEQELVITVNHRSVVSLGEPEDQNESESSPVDNSGPSPQSDQKDES